MVTPIVAFASLFQEFGLQQAVIQSRDITQEQQTRLFWLNIALSIVVAGSLALASPMIAAFYGDERVRLLAICWTVPLLAGALGAQHQALLARNARFGAMATIDVAAISAGFAAAIVAAWLWQSYWALWVSAVVTAAATSIGQWSRSGWRPGAPWTRAKVGPLLHFGANLTGFSFLNFFSRNLDNVIIARFAGGTALGFYDRAYKLLLFPLQNINAPVTRVMVPLLSRVQAEPERFRQAYIKAAGLVALATIPGIATATACSEEVMRVLLGPAWLPAAAIFGWLGISGLMQPISNTTGWVFIAQGKSRQMLLWGIYSSVVTVASFFIGIYWGVTGLAAAYAIGGWVVRLPVLYAMLDRIGPVSAKDLAFLQLPLTAAAVATFAIAYGLADLGFSGIALILMVLVTAYALSALTMLTYPQGRGILRSAYELTTTRRLSAAVS